MKRWLTLFLAFCMSFGSAAFAESAVLTPGTYTGTGRGYSETVPVTVTITVDEKGITKAVIEGAGEEPFGHSGRPPCDPAPRRRRRAERPGGEGSAAGGDQRHRDLYQSPAR